MPTTTIQPAWQTYIEELAMLGHGLALWQPAPLPHSYEKVKIGDVGYIRQGRFHLLFSAAIPLGDRKPGEDVPLDFEPFDPGPIVRDQPRLPGALHADYIELKGAAFNASSHGTSIGVGTTFQFQTSSRKGAILVTKYKTFPEDAERLGRFKEYMLQHHRSWVDHANKLGHMVELHDVLFVTGYDMTLDFSMLAFSSNSKQIGIEFSAGVPAVGSASAAAWGTWRTAMSMHHNCGPQRQYPHSDLHLLTDNDSSMATHAEYNQCVFLRGYRIRKRAGLIPKVIKAAAGPHDFGSGHKFDEAGPAVECDGNNSGSDSEIIAAPESPLFVDPLKPLFDYVFDNSNADIAIMHDSDFSDLLKITPTAPVEGVNNLLSMLSPQVNIGTDGLAYILPVNDFSNEVLFPGQRLPYVYQRHRLRHLPRVHFPTVGLKPLHQQYAAHLSTHRHQPQPPHIADVEYNPNHTLKPYSNPSHKDTLSSHSSPRHTPSLSDTLMLDQGVFPVSRTKHNFILTDIYHIHAGSIHGVHTNSLFNMYEMATVDSDTNQPICELRVHQIFPFYTEAFTTKRQDEGVVAQFGFVRLKRSGKALKVHFTPALRAELKNGICHSGITLYDKKDEDADFIVTIDGEKDADYQDISLAVKGDEKNADFIVDFDGKDAVFTTNLSAVTDHGYTRLPQVVPAKLEHIVSVLRAALQWTQHLDPTHSNWLDNIEIEFCSLEKAIDTAGVPVIDRKREVPAIEKNTVSLTVSPDNDDMYGMVIHSKTPLDLHVSIVAFDIDNLEILPCFSGAFGVEGKGNTDPSIWEGKDLTVGYGNGGGVPFMFVPPKNGVSVTILKLYFTSMPMDFGWLEQASPFLKAGDRSPRRLEQFKHSMTSQALLGATTLFTIVQRAPSF